jgi:23S rRNA maturation mini-RNase III
VSDYRTTRRIDSISLNYLGKCQTDNGILRAKLISREQDFDRRFKALHDQYVRTRKQYEHVSSCIKEFHVKLQPIKRLKHNRTDETNHRTSDNSIEHVTDIDMHVKPILSQTSTVQ